MQVSNAHGRSALVTFSRHAQSSKAPPHTEDIRSVQFNLTSFKDCNEYYLITANKHYCLKVFNEVPKDYDTVPYWSVYTTQWNAFVGYKDFNSSTKICELLTYLSVQVGTAPEELVDGHQNLPDDIDIDSDAATKKYRSIAADDVASDAVMIQDVAQAILGFAASRGSKEYIGKRVSHVTYGVKNKEPYFEHVSRSPLKNAQEKLWYYF